MNNQPDIQTEQDKNIILLEKMSLDELNKLIENANNEIEFRKFKDIQVKKLRLELQEEKNKLNEKLKKYEENEILKMRVRINKINEKSDEDNVDDEEDIVVDSKKLKSKKNNRRK